MKKLLPILYTILSTLSYGQSYSTFYGTYDVNQNVNVNKDVKVSGTVNQNVNKTVRTIDYGALAAANAQKEANRLNKIQYEDSRDAMRAQEIAADPYAAYKYGNKAGGALTRSESGKLNKKYDAGHFRKKITWSWTQPSSLLFTRPFSNTFRNTNSDGSIECIVHVFFPENYSYNQEKYGKERYPETEFIAKTKALKIQTNKKVGEAYTTKNGDNIYTHKTEIGRATVYGRKGYRATWIYESDYEYVIKDYYYSDREEILFAGQVQYSVDKTRGTFEDLEGRRYYLRRVVEEVIGTAYFDLK